MWVLFSFDKMQRIGEFVGIIYLAREHEICSMFALPTEDDYVWD